MTNLGRRSVTAVSWNAVANLISMVVLLARSVVLARLLPVETFGVYASANAIVSLSAWFANFGTGDALLNRTEHTQDEDTAAAVHFTLAMLMAIVWAVLMGVGVAAFAMAPALKTAMLTLVVVTAIAQAGTTPHILLTRRVVHRRLALEQVLIAIISSVVAVILAVLGFQLWALLSTDLCRTLVILGVMYGWRPAWRPRLGWSAPIVKYYLQFGSRNVFAISLEHLLGRFDDLWVRYYLGNLALGYYSRAYSFAEYPKRIFALPIRMVAGGTYAELKGNRPKLSQAFMISNGFLIRSGFAIAGLMVICAPEFIEVVLGAKWLPMLGAFQLLLVFSLLDPIRATVAGLFPMMGEPGQLVRIRLIQLVILVGGLYGFGFNGIVGVSVAANAMMVVGIALLLTKARAYVDYSFWALLGPPLLALILGGTVALLLQPALAKLPYLWQIGLLKALIFFALYCVVLVLTEWQQLKTMTMSVLSKLR